MPIISGRGCGGGLSTASGGGEGESYVPPLDLKKES